MKTYYRTKAALAQAGAALCDLIDKQFVMRLFRVSSHGGMLYNVTMNTSLDLAGRAAYFDDVQYRALTTVIEKERAALDSELTEEWRDWQYALETETDESMRFMADLDFESYLDYYEHCVVVLRAKQTDLDTEFGLMFIR